MCVCVTEDVYVREGINNGTAIMIWYNEVSDAVNNIFIRGSFLASSLVEGGKRKRFKWKEGSGAD